MYEIHCGPLTRYVTACPPLPTEWGAAWWIRVDDVWIRIRRREMGERVTPELERELCGLLEQIFRRPVESAREMEEPETRPS